jgi:hypothetical protein
MYDQRYSKQGIPQFRGKRKTPLDTRNPRVQELSQKYNLAPKTVAYLRAALGTGRYGVTSLIEHIHQENDLRWKAIEEHKVNPNLRDDEREKLIEYTQINIRFREGVVDCLQRITMQQLDDILK